MNQCYDFVIIGAGIAGTSLAYELASDHKVLVLEAEEQPGYHSTGRSAAVFLSAYDAHVPALRQLSEASFAFLSDPPPDFASEGFLSHRDLLLVGCEDDAALEDYARQFRKLYPKVRLLAKEESSARAPALRGKWNSPAVFYPELYEIEVASLHQAYQQGFRRRGGEIVCRAPVEVITREADFWLIGAANQNWSARVLVNAAGAWADPVAQLAGLQPLGIKPHRRTAILVEPAPGWKLDDWPFIADAEGEFYFKPDAGLLMASPSDETPCEPCDAQPEELDIAIAAHFVGEALGHEVRRVSHSWAGLRSFVPDRSPVIGFDPDADGFFWFAGQGGHGIQTAPAAARLAASLLRNTKLPEDLSEMSFKTASVSPDRLPARSGFAKDPDGIDARLLKLGLELPAPMHVPPGITLPFVSAKRLGSRMVLAGHLPLQPDGSIWENCGKVGAKISIEEAYSAARAATLAMLASVQREVGSLDRVKCWSRIFGMVNTAPGFTNTSAVVNGCSDLLIELFGPVRGSHVRSAVGFAELPMDVPVEIEGELELE